MSSYTSRKFIITVSSITLTGALAFLGKMTGDVAVVLAAAIGSYNLANAWVTGKGNGAAGA